LRTDFTHIRAIETFNDGLVFVGFTELPPPNFGDIDRLAYIDKNGDQHDLNTHGFRGRTLEVEGGILHVDDNVIDDRFLTVDTNWNVTPHGELLV
jgi:hypothetical protein